VGIYDNLLFSSTIDRNKKLIPGEVLEAVIHGTQECFAELRSHGIHIEYLGGETADVGDLVRTIAVNGTMAARWQRSRIISNDKISAGDLIVGLSSSGRASYEKKYNSGIGSNGLTSARHDVLGEMYGTAYPESFDPGLEQEVVYTGPCRLADEVKTETGETLSVGQLLLSPTRTYAPVVKALLEQHFDLIHGMVHSSGGGQTKCLKYLPRPLRVIKDHLFEPPVIFKLIQESSGADDREMYQVFNMGQRLEIFTGPDSATALLGTIRDFGIEARVIGRVEAAAKKELLIDTGKNRIGY
jgi:phosphoribosylformylglycinamidine cyclo-ligase